MNSKYPTPPLLYPWLDINREEFLCLEPCSLGRQYVLDKHNGDMYLAWSNMTERPDYMIWLIGHCPGSITAAQAREVALEFVMRFLPCYMDIADTYPITARISAIDSNGDYSEYTPTSEQAKEFILAAYHVLTNDYITPTTPYDTYTYHLDMTDCVYNTGGWRDVSPNGIEIHRTREMKNVRRAVGILRSALRLYRSLAVYQTEPNAQLSPEKYVHNIIDQIIDSAYIVGYDDKAEYNKWACDMIRRIVTPILAKNSKLFSQHDEESE